MNNNLIPIVVEADEAAVLLDFGAVSIVGQSELPVYDGDYQVRPTWFNQILTTRGKRMTDDVLIYDIPLSETSNDAGGLTLNIGG